MRLHAMLRGALPLCVIFLSKKTAFRCPEEERQRNETFAALRCLIPNLRINSSCWQPPRDRSDALRHTILERAFVRLTPSVTPLGGLHRPEALAKIHLPFAGRIE